ncbi:MAG: Gfo/Idh/MocA family oxidoreductase [Trueperaceae bacterium]
MPPLRFALIGAGNIARTHAAALADLPDAVLTVVSGGRGAEAFAHDHGARFVEDPLHAIGDDEADAVLLCTPSGAREAHALAAADAGRHLLVEKPIEVTVQRARAMSEAHRRAGTTLGVIFQSRFKPGPRALEAALRAGRLGDPVLGDLQVKWHRPPSYFEQAPWRGTRALDGGGALINQAIHGVDQLMWLMGDVAEVSARWARRLHRGIEVEDTLAAHLTYTSGALGTLSVTTATWPGWDRHLEVHGTDGSVRLADDRVTAWDLRDGSAPPPDAAAAISSGSAASPAIGDARWHREQIADFVAAVRDGRTPAVDGPEGTRSLVLVEACYRSAETGTPVTIS